MSILSNVLCLDFTCFCIALSQYKRHIFSALITKSRLGGHSNFFLAFPELLTRLEKNLPQTFIKGLAFVRRKNDILSNEDRVGAFCKGRSLLNCKFKYQFTFSWHVWNVAEYLVMVCSSSITWRVHCTVHTHCTLCTRSFPRAHIFTSGPDGLPSTFPHLHN